MGVTTTIKVTQDLIDKAVPRNSSHCMIADAVKVAIPDAKIVSVDLATIRYSRKGKRYTFLTPPTAQDGLIAFDEGDARLQPFAFRLREAVQITDTGRKRKDSTDDAVRVSSTHSSRPVPVKLGGRPVPAGPLAGGDTANRVRTGKIRRYGLKSMGRSVQSGDDSSQFGE